MTESKRYAFCPICSMELRIRKDGKFPRHSPHRESVVRLKDGTGVDLCKGSNVEASLIVEETRE